MSYSHVTVSEAIMDHEKAATRIKEVVPPESKHEYVKYEGVLIRKELAMFMADVEKAMRGVKFYVRQNLKWGWGKVEIPDSSGVMSRSVELYHEVLVAFPDQQYCMGTIGYGTFQKSTSNNVYAVSSRTIKNDKYADHNEEHHYVMTSDIKRAVKNAKTHLRPYTPKDFFGLSISSAHYTARKPLVDASTNERISRNHLPNIQLMNELYRLHKAGHVFADSQLSNAVAEWVAAVEIEEAERKREVRACYVHVRPQTAAAASFPENQLVDIYVTYNLRDGQWSQSKVIDSVTPEVVKVSDLHPDFLGKLSVLSLLTDGDHVDEVGIRVSENVYWVFLGSENTSVKGST